MTAELAALKTSSTSTEKALAARTREKTALERKLKDRDAELKGKAQLIEEVQDEMVGMEMAVNVAEETQPSTMTTTWLDDYLTTLDIRDAHEKANEATINACEFL